MSLIRYSVNNPLIVNLLMVAIIVLGVFSLVNLPRELMPKVSFNWAFVFTVYPGVGAEEIEKLLSIPIEDAVDDIDDIKTISTESNEGTSFVWVQFDDINESTFENRVREIESALNKLKLPDGAEDPIVDEFDSDDFIPVISISIAGNTSEKVLYDLAKDLKDDILDIKGVGQVAVSGTRDREIWIEVNQQKLHQHRLSLGQVVQSISGRNLNIPAGSMSIGRENFLVRSIGEVGTPEGFKNIVVRWDPRGNHLYLGEIATVKDRWEKESSRARIDDQPAATLSISKKANANSLDIISKIKSLAREYQPRLPLGTRIIFTNDNSIYINDILMKLQSNAQLGFVLVLLVLYLFMGLRNAFIAALGIPVAFMATFIFLYQAGHTFNGNSLFGLILVLGMVVDDAIIVVENCFRHLQRGLSRSQAAIVGASEVLSPVLAATLTTIAAFLPLILMTGIMGKFMRLIPIVVSLTLFASIIEVFVIAPSHFAELGGLKRVGKSQWFERLKKLYTKVLMKMLRVRYLVLPLVVILAVVMSGIIPLVGVDLFSGDQISQFMIWVRMPVGTPLEETDHVIRRIESAAKELNQDEIHAVIGNTGILQTESDWVYGDHVGQVIVDLVEKNFRDRSVDDIMDDLRKRTKSIEGPLEVRYAKVSGGPPVGKPVEVKVKGKYLDELEVVAEKVKLELATIPGVSDIGDDHFPGKREIRLIIDETRASYYGLTVAYIALEVRMAIDGVQATIYREGDEEVDVRVKMAGFEDGDLNDIRGLVLMTPTGSQVRLDNICRFEMAPTLFRIRRFEGERAITVSANVDRRVATPVTVNNELARRFEHIAHLHPGYRLDFRGEMEEFKEAFSELIKLFFVGVVLIFTILGAQFKSLRQSFIILLTIPFGFIGSMLGLAMTGNPFSIVVMYGMVALAGIAVNDAIVMVSFINNARARGAGKWRSIIESGRIRLRPIIMTSVTTILGLMPMAIGIGGKSDSWSPLANTVVWGLAAATMLTLLVIPVVYSIFVDDWFGLVPLRKYMKRKKLRKNFAAWNSV